MDDRQKRVMEIYNGCWLIYKKYLSNHDMSEYNRNVQDLSNKYGNQDDVVDLILWFAPIVNDMHAEYLKNKKAGDVNE